MANIFTRIKDTISADLHQLLDEKEQKNPTASLNQFLRQAEQQKLKVKKALERQYKLQQNFNKEYRIANDFASKRFGQAKIAEEANEMELYEFAMREYEDYQTRAQKLHTALQTTSEQIDLLERKYEEMNHKLKDMHIKRLELMGRENIAKAHYEMNQVLHEDVTKSSHRFRELEDFIQNIETKVNEIYYQNTFEQKIAELEKLARKEN